MTERASHVLIAGAGPTGLMAGWKLAERGHRVTIVESAPVVGGMSASFDVSGQRVDFGSHRLHGKADPELLLELRTLMGPDLQSRQRNGRIRLEGEWVGFPLRAVDLATSLPKRFAFGAAMDSLTSKWRKPDGADFGSIVRAGLGPTVFDSFYGPYAKKLWGVDASELDGSMAQRRVSAGSPIDVAKRLFSARNEQGRVFYYPRGGYGQLSETLAKAATSAGAELFLETSLAGLGLESGVVATVVAGGQERTMRADVAISTIPAATLTRISHPTPMAEVISAADALQSRGMVFVYLVVPRDRYTEFDAHYFPGLDTVIARLSEPKNYRKGSDPIGQTVLCAEVACSVGDEIWAMEDDALGDLVAGQLADQGLAHPEHIGVHVRRLGSVYPVYRHGYSAHLDVIESWVGEQSNLLNVGRQGLFAPDNFHHTVAMGRASAEAIRLDGSIDRGSWQEAREGFRSHVVED